MDAGAYRPQNIKIRIIGTPNEASRYIWGCLRVGDPTKDLTVDNTSQQVRRFRPRLLGGSWKGLITTCTIKNSVICISGDLEGSFILGLYAQLSAGSEYGL